MSKNFGNSDDDRTEFNFSDAEEITTAPPSASVTRSRSSGFSDRFGGALFADSNKRKMILLSVGLIVGILAIFKILSWLWSPSSKPAPTQTVAPAPSIQQTAPLPLQPAKQVSAPAPAETRPEMNLMDQTNKAQTEQIQKMQQKVGQLEMTIEDLQTQLAMMSQLVQTMSLQLQQSTAQKTTKPVPESKKEKATIQNKVIETPIYYIQAMVPGRVWLANQSGAATTLSVGDEIPGYGFINRIDLEQGIVTTDQGKSIRYHPGDR